MAKRGPGRRTAAEWAREVAGWRQSGKTAAAYAAERGLKASTLSWWAWKLRHDVESCARREITLVPVEIVGEEGDADAGGEWELVTVEGHRLRGDGGLAPELAAALVTAVVRGR